MQDGQYGSVRPDIQTVQGYGGEEERSQDGRGVGWGAGDGSLMRRVKIYEHL